jgi:hypothetical protein
MLDAQNGPDRIGTFVAGSGSDYTTVVTPKVQIESRITAVYAPTAATLYRDSKDSEPEFSYILRNSTKPRIEADDITLVEHQVLENARPKSRFVTTSRRTITCEVDEVLESSFTAVYWDSRGPRRVRFKLSELTPEDRELVEPRAELHWSVGTEMREDGRRSTTSLVLFRRRPPISPAQWQAALHEATATAQQLGWDLVSPEDEPDRPVE